MYVDHCRHLVPSLFLSFGKLSKKILIIYSHNIGTVQVVHTRETPGKVIGIFLLRFLSVRNENSDFAPVWKLPKGKLNKNNFEEWMKSSQPIAPISSGSSQQTFCDKGAPKEDINCSSRVGNQLKVQ